MSKISNQDNLSEMKEALTDVLGETVVSLKVINDLNDVSTCHSSNSTCIGNPEQLVFAMRCKSISIARPCSFIGLEKLFRLSLTNVGYRERTGQEIVDANGLEVILSGMSIYTVANADFQKRHDSFS